MQSGVSPENTVPGPKPKPKQNKIVAVKIKNSIIVKLIINFKLINVTSKSPEIDSIATRM